MTPSLMGWLPTILAWQNFEGGRDPGGEAAGAAAIFGLLCFYGVVFIISIGIAAAILYIQYKVLERVPPQYRQMEPWQVFLVLIPCFGIVWLFFVVLRVPGSLQNYFNAKQRYDVGDCGAQLGLWYAITAVIGCGPIALVMLILYLMKIWELQKQIT